MGALLCPRCEDGGNLRWENPDDPNLLDTGKMVCLSCRARYIGIPGWLAATKKKEKPSSVDFGACLQIFLADHPAGSAGTKSGRWVLSDSDGKTVAYGKGMLDACKHYVHARYGQGPVRRRLP